jgi:TetR/AcrR family transcriptional repressor of nem operon
VLPDVKHFDPDATLGEAMALFWRQGFTSTGIQDVVTATGVNRSSLYATFGGKRDLYLAALGRYVEQRALPPIAALAADTRGLPAIEEFFARLIQQRCSGEHARFGCMLANAHVGPESIDRDVQRVLTLFHERLVRAMRAALGIAGTRGQVAADLDLNATADLLALVAYGVNVRSRAGSGTSQLRGTISALLSTLGADTTNAEH